MSIKIGHVFIDKTVTNGVYIGRYNAKAGLKASPFKNPYSVQQYGREKCIALYKEYITKKLKDDPGLREELMALKGTTLLCWCQSLDGKLDKPCHGEVLRELVDQYQTSFHAQAVEYIELLYNNIIRQTDYMCNPEVNYTLKDFTHWLYSHDFMRLYLKYYTTHKREDIPAISRNGNVMYLLSSMSIMPAGELKRQRLIVAGGRDFDKVGPIKEVLEDVHKTHPDTVVISGMAKGVDITALRIARNIGLETLECPADWRPNGVYDAGAGCKRNAYMASIATHLIAFHDGASRGTAHMVAIAAKHKLYSRVIPYK